MDIQIPSAQTTLAILLGASEWPESPDFPGSKAFNHAMSSIRSYLFDPHGFGLPKENALDLFDESSSPHVIDRKIRQFLDSKIAEMKSTGNGAKDLLLYFVGHAGFVGRNSDYYLAVRCTSTEDARLSGIPMESLASTLTTNARYLRRIIILDCCYAAAAFTSFQAEGPAKLGIDQTVRAFEKQAKKVGKGTTLLCSSGKNVASQIAQDQSCTMFSKALLQVLFMGDERRQEQHYFSLREVADLTEEVITRELEGKAPRPEIHSPDQSEGDVADVPFFPNPWFEKERLRRAEEERARIAEEAKERARIAEEERARKVEEDRRRQAEAERTRKAGEEWVRKAQQEGRAEEFEDFWEDSQKLSQKKYEQISRLLRLLRDLGSDLSQSLTEEQSEVLDRLLHEAQKLPWHLRIDLIRHLSSLEARSSQASKDKQVDLLAKQRTEVSGEGERLLLELSQISQPQHRVLCNLLAIQEDEYEYRLFLQEDKQRQYEYLLQQMLVDFSQYKPGPGSPSLRGMVPYRSGPGLQLLSDQEQEIFNQLWLLLPPEKQGCLFLQFTDWFNKRPRREQEQLIQLLRLPQPVCEELFQGLSGVSGPKLNVLFKEWSSLLPLTQQHLLQEWQQLSVHAQKQFFQVWERLGPREPGTFFPWLRSLSGQQREELLSLLSHEELSQWLRELPEDQRLRLYQEWQRVPLETRKALLHQWEQLSSNDRQLFFELWINLRHLRKDEQVLQRWQQYHPEQEHEEMLQWLQGAQSPKERQERQVFLSFRLLRTAQESDRLSRPWSQSSVDSERQ